VVLEDPHGGGADVGVEGVGERVRPQEHLVAGGRRPVPGAVNALTHLPGASAAVKRLGGIDPHRDVPRFARRSLRRQLAGHRSPPTGNKVLLWPDTFTNAFDPQIGTAAVRVLEHHGYEVLLPDKALCCGLTWISTGQLPTAIKVLGRTVKALAPIVRQGIPVVGLEPSCTAVFRHDLCELFGNDEDAHRLAGCTSTLAELLHDADLPRMAGSAIVQGHCHHKAVMEMDADADVLAATGLDAEILDSGCCGLAGDFGFSRGHHEVSMACAERVLAPAVRAAGDGTWVLADGFSCRTQIADVTGRRARHLAEVLAEAVDRSGR
jgi:Fe-S oxidoreductase